MPNASAAYGTTMVPASTSKGCGNRQSRCHSRQMIASSPNPLPRLGFTWPRSMARRSTTMSRANPISNAKKAPETPLTIRGVAVYRIGPGGTFDLDRWRGTQGISYTLSAVAGVLTSSNGSVY